MTRYRFFTMGFLLAFVLLAHDALMASGAHAAPESHERQPTMLPISISQIMLGSSGPI